MSSYVGPNGRLYRHTSRNGLWIGLTIVCITVLGSMIIGLKNVAVAFSFIGL